MIEANVIFTFNGIDSTIQCTIEDKMKDICEKYSRKINKEMNSLVFLYGGNQINFELKFKDQANHLDLKENKMNILVYENELFICPKCKQIIQLNIQKLNDIILFNKKIIDTISGIKFQIDNIIKISESSPINTQLKNINKLFDIINEDIKNNYEKIKKNNLLNYYNKYSNINNNKNNIKKSNLLENIKPNDFYKKLFSHVNEKIKLKLIKYNKKLKNKIDIKLINYKYYK